MAQDILEFNGTEYELGAKAENVSYNNSVSGMTATNVEAAIDELAARPQGGGGSGTYAPFSGKEIAVIGDSFTHYTYNDTSWFKQMCPILGAIEGYNAAKVAAHWYGRNLTEPTGSGRCGCDMAQDMVSHYANLDHKPDYILVVMGVNDITRDVRFNKMHVSNDNLYSQLGNLVYTASHDGNELAALDSALATFPYSFTAGVQATLTVLKKAFPDAIIKIGWTPSGFQMMYNGFIFGGKASLSDSTAVDSKETWMQYRQRLELCANMYGVQYIDTLGCGISYFITEDWQAYTRQGAGEVQPSNADMHPSVAGHARIAQYMARLMLSNL